MRMGGPVSKIMKNFEGGLPESVVHPYYWGWGTHSYHVSTWIRGRIGCWADTMVEWSSAMIRIRIVVTPRYCYESAKYKQPNKIYIN